MGIFFTFQELEPILKQLDPNGHGRVTFQDFCQRVKEITLGKYVIKLQAYRIISFVI